MSVNITQPDRVAQTAAELVHYALSWSEPMNGDDIDKFISVFKNTLKELNGED